MKIKCVRCLVCGDVIYSRTVHDYRCCQCGSVCVDGGFEYSKISARDPSQIEFIEIEVNAIKEELYRDWNLGIDKYGLIRKGELNR